MESKLLKYVAGMDGSTVRLLAKHRIRFVHQLLERCVSAETTKQFAQEIGVSRVRVRRWVKNAEMLQIDGLSNKYILLLNNAGVRSIEQLAQAQEVQLLQQLAAANNINKVVHRLPNREQVSDWISQANQLSPLIM